MTKRLRIGVRMPPCRPADELGDFAARVEKAGFDTLYVPDSQTLWRDAFLTLYAAAGRTSTLRLATAVSNVVTRHPSVVAGLARGIDEVAPGRFVLGLGVGHSSVEPIGLPPSRGAELRDGVDQIRRLVRGEDVAYGEAVARLRDPRPAGVPIHVAATGPRNLRLAGEIADGVILLSGVAAAPLERAVAAVREGAEAAGRRFEDIEITVSAHALVTDDIERDARIMKPIAAAIAQRGGAAALAAAGIEVDVPAHVPEVVPDLVHAEDWQHAVEVCSRWISDEDAVAFARTFGLFGTASEIAELVRATQARGATGIFFQHVGSWDLPEALVDEVGSAVLPLLAEQP
ncbi:LLM class flavin-dependent oxidoreductase [Nocardioides nitrophenolicus]|uniref:LLM class flavin-dependent oxidoreductase n=1 Tax=Nocardioides nitrophenolicus TaxID=60489 RepID=UPI00195778CA|nr:LLM class flavin-dependent oxidoreductase [Nocardioides nitrophenolicus]MBM7517073.1 5,10-methylenetetrahydromethanopterin reductase [Nocardioides nitrophenolicus]